MLRILFVCHGNICRSAAALYIMRDLVHKAGLDAHFVLDSAATSTEEIGNPVYPPMKRTLEAHGIRCGGHHARQMRPQDYADFDLLIAMDSENIWYMDRMYHNDPEGKFRMLMDYGEGQVALVGGAFDQDSGWEVEIVGETGSIRIGPEFWHPTTAALATYAGERETFTEDYPATGFQFEIRAVQDCLRKGLAECPDYTWADMTRVTDIIEAARKAHGIVYPADQGAGNRA